MQDRICLIVPCFNEAARLDLPQFEAAAAAHPVWFVFVDDGSTDGTGDLVRRHASERIRLVTLDRNRGKAEAVRQGMLHAAAQPDFDRMDWLGFWDADLSTPLDELPRFLDYLAFAGVQADAIFGCRVSRLGSRIRRRPARHVLGRLFVTVASLVLGVRAYDSQCGAKLFRRAVVPTCFGAPFVTRWLFDLEILLRLGEAGVLEYPLGAWHEVPGSKLRVLPNMFRTLRDLARLRAEYLRR